MSYNINPALKCCTLFGAMILNVEFILFLRFFWSVFIKNFLKKVT